MSYALEISTRNTPNGASRRGWLIFDPSGLLLGFLAATRMGDFILRHAFPDVIVLAQMELTPRQYNHKLKDVTRL